MMGVVGVGGRWGWGWEGRWVGRGGRGWLEA